MLHCDLQFIFYFFAQVRFCMEFGENWRVLLGHLGPESFALTNAIVIVAAALVFMLGC